MACKIICDIGSCHGNRIEYFERAIRVARDLGVELKCQLFGEEQAKNGNIRLDPAVFSTAMMMATDADVTMFASVWGRDDYLLLRDQPSARAVKFAYSQRDNPLIQQAAREFETVYVSCQHLDIPQCDPPNLKRLLSIPEYPVYFRPNFSGCFPPFEGFSDHTLGWIQSAHAAEEGARVIEKHVKFEGCTDCPDARFAIDEVELEKLATYVNN